MNKEKEIETVTLMVRRYCRDVHGTRSGALCPAYNALPENVSLAAIKEKNLSKRSLIIFSFTAQ